MYAKQLHMYEVYSAFFNVAGLPVDLSKFTLIQVWAATVQQILKGGFPLGPTSPEKSPG